MKILQLCCFTNLWPPHHEVTSIDLRNNCNVLNLPSNSGKDFDLVVAAPPCTQFTKANSPNWTVYPEEDVLIAEKCLEICQSTSSFWFLENPPGRIEEFIPALKQFRVLNWRGAFSNKEYILYSNFLIMAPTERRYGKNHRPWTKQAREAWLPDMIQTVHNSIPFLELFR